MLRFWNSSTEAGHQVYQDDEDPHKFYVMPKGPTIGRTSEGKLAFMFRKYRFADAAQAKRKGGGYVTFDVTLEVPTADQTAIVAALKNRYNAAPKDGVTNVNQIHLAALPFTDGTVTLNIRENDKTNFVDSVTALGKPSSDGKFTASFSAALSPEGATYFENVMSGKGAGAVQVVYALKTFFRSGDTVVTASFNKNNTLKYKQEITKSNQIWRESTYKEEISSVVKKYELVKVDATFSNNETEKQKEDIRKWATDAVTDAVKRQLPSLSKPVDGTTQADSTTRIYDFSNVEDFSQTFRERIAMLMELYPQGMLPSVESMTDSDGKKYAWKDYFDEIDLDDPWFQTLRLRVSNAADFSSTSLSRLNVDLWYEADGKKHFTTLGFDKDHNEVKEWSPFGKTDKYDYQYTAYFQAGPTYTSPRYSAISKELVLGPTVNGLLQIDAIATGINFELVKNIAVKVQIVDPTTNAKGTVTTAFLDSKKPQSRISLVVGEKFAQPYTYEYSLAYTLQDGVRIEKPVQLTSDAQLLVMPCFSDVRRITVAAPTLTEGDSATVSLCYSEGGYSRRKTLQLDIDNKTALWELGVIDRTAGELTYSASIDLKNGDSSDIPQTRVEGSNDTIRIAPKPASDTHFIITVDPSGVDWDGQHVQNVSLSLRYGEAEQNLNFRIADRDTVKTVKWPRIAKLGEYVWKAVYIYKPDKKSVRLASPPQTSDDSYFLIPSPEDINVDV